MQWYFVVTKGGRWGDYDEVVTNIKKKFLIHRL